MAINEAIEVAKTYGGLNSGRFVNGVMGTVYREIGEPDKKDIIDSRTDDKAIPEKKPSVKKDTKKEKAE